MRKKEIKQSVIKEINKRFSMLCRYYRTKNGLTAVQMGEKLGCSKSMIEAYENPKDSRGPAKSYSMLSRLASGLDMSTSGFIHVLEGKANEEMELDEINNEFSHRLSKLSTKTISNLLHLLDSEKERLEDIIEVAVKISTREQNLLKIIDNLLCMTSKRASIIFSMIEQIKDIDRE